METSTSSPDAAHRLGAAVEVGSKARTARLRHGMTLDQLAAATGLSKGHLSRFERGEKTLSIAALMQVSWALRTPVSVLLGEHAGEGPFHLVRHGEAVARSAPLVDGRYAYRSLSRPTADGSLSAFAVTLPENASRTSEAVHAGEEAFLVLSGTVEVDLAGHRLVLGAGDYLQFPGTLRHRLRSVAGESRVFIVVAGA